MESSTLTWPLSPATKMRNPVRSKVISVLRCSGLGRLIRSMPGRVSQIWMAPVPSLTARRVPSALKAVWPVEDCTAIVRSSRAGPTFQSRTVPSSLLEYNWFPSRLNTTSTIEPVWPESLNNSFPEVTSHRIIFLSIPPVAIRLPSGLNATVKTRLVCPVRVSNWPPDSAFQRYTSFPLWVAICLPSGLYLAPRTHSG